MTLRPAVLLAGLACFALGAWLAASLHDRRRDALRSEVASAPEPARIQDGTPPDAELASERRAAAPAVGEPNADAAAPALARPADAPWATARPRDVRRVHVFGRVEDEQGAPIAGAALVAPRGEAQAVLARTDGAGSFDAELALDLGRRALREALWNGMLEAAVEAEGYAARAVELDVRPGARFHLGTLRLAPGWPIEGRVVDPAGAGVAGAEVTWQPADQLAGVDELLAEGILPASFPGYEGLLLDARSLRDGSFRLPGVPRASGFVSALAPGGAHGKSELLAPDGGLPGEVLIALPYEERAPRIAGRVLRPDGAPHPGARIEVTLQGSLWIEDRADVDDQGAFEIEWQGEPDAVLILRAVDPEQQFCASEPATARLGDQDVVLQLLPPRTVLVRLVDALGAPIPWGHVQGRGAHQGWPLTGLGAEGQGTFLLPPGPFSVEAMAPGFRTATFGPFEAAEGTLELALTAGEAVRGRVLAEGRPVEGARVALTRTPFAAGLASLARGVAPPDQPFDFRAAVAMDELDATTAADGTFVATLHDDGWFTVAAEAPGYARRVLGPFEWTRAEGAAGLELDLERPGAIEGRVVVAPGESPAGRFVAASDGLGEAWIAAADGEGRFRLEGLAPGAWQLRPAVPPVGERERLGSSGRPRAQAPRFDVRVLPGKTAQAVLELLSPERVVQGRITLDGTGLAGGSVELHPGDSLGQAFDHALASAVIDSEGTFVLRTCGDGAVVLSIRHDNLSVHQPLELLPGANDWQLDLPTATLMLSGSVPDDPQGETPLLALRARAPSGASVFCIGRLRSPTGEALRLERAPAGSVELLSAPLRDWMRQGPLDETLWTHLADLRLEVGRETAFSLP